MADTLTDKLGMSDVTAALANFAFYASVARAQVHTVVYNRYNTPSGTHHCHKSTVMFKPTREGNTIVLAQRTPMRLKREELMAAAERIEAQWDLPATKWLRVFKPVQK